MNRVYDIYVSSLEKSSILQKLEPEKRNKIIQQSASRLYDEGVLQPLHLSWDDADDDFIEQDDESKEVEKKLYDRDEQIRQKQLSYGIEPTEKRDKNIDGIPRNKWGRTKLHDAVENRNFELVVKLIEEGHDIYIKDNNGHTAIHVAALNEDVEMLQLFVKLGVSL